MLPGLAPSVIPGGGWNIATLVYTGDFLDVAAVETGLYGPFFSPDGIFMYISGTSSARIHQFTLSTAWAVATATLTRNYDPSAQVSIPFSVYLREDGLRLYVAGGLAGRVYQYNLSTAWNLSTMSYSGNSDDVSSQEPQVLGVFFKDDGSKMYVTGASDAVYEYSLSTAWDVSTSTYTGVSLNVTVEEGGPSGLFFKPDGKVMYVTGSVGDAVHEYALSTAWALSTAVYTRSASLSAQDTSPRGSFFRPDGRKMYVGGAISDAVLEYNLS